MNKIIDKYFELLNSDDLKTVQESLLTIAGLMEMHTWQLSIDDRKQRFDYLYDRDILELELNDFELRECVDRICQILYPLLKSGYDFKESDHSISTNITFTLLRALEESPSRIALEPSLRLFSSCYRFMNDRVCYWMILPLAEFVVIHEDLTTNQKKSILERSNILDILEEKLLTIDRELVGFSADNDLRAAIISLVENINELIG